MYLGVDLGTSSIKVVLSNETDGEHASARAPVETFYPAKGRVEQSPDDWIAAFECAMAALAETAGEALARVEAIGFSGHMHTLLLLGKDGRPVRPASIWSDFRAVEEAQELRRTGLADRLGVKPMPGFTGPKLLWTARHDPKALADAACFAFPKDYLRQHLTGEIATDPTDAAGSWLFDQASRTWDSETFEACAAASLSRPALVGSGEVAGVLRAEIAQRFGMRPGIPVATGAGDVAAGAAGLGVVSEGEGMISLGTSAQVFVARGSYRPAVGRAVHSHAHVAPGTWYDMAALLNGASALGKTAGWLGYDSVQSLISAVEARHSGPGTLLALPYLAGERTPHDDPAARAAFVGMSATTETWELALSMMEAIAFSLADGADALGSLPDCFALTGGGSRSPFLCQLIADVLDRPLVRSRGSEVGPALGAARLARAAATRSTVAECCPALPEEAVYLPDPARHAAYAERLEAYRALYAGLSSTFLTLEA
ncbi:xylulokinase [Tropicimonas sp. IMCC34011]|uniref:xylulokinase n=1 Tax=Tropicimonas sp. IMCC34011 TaxID=2248759 RepID=UPI000E278279|nr:xylulokinase [Tropicimonas sp. IMCC34011]